MASARVVENCPDKVAATTNYVYVAERDPYVKYNYVELGGYVFNLAGHPQVTEGTIAMNKIQRKIVRVEGKEKVELAAYFPPSAVPSTAMVYGEIGSVADKNVRPADLQAEEVISKLIKSFTNQVITEGQQIAFDLDGVNYKLVITSMIIDVAGKTKEITRGWLRSNTAFIFTQSGTNPIKVVGQKGYATTQIFKPKTMNFEQLGIGGLDKQFETIFRRAFASRVFPPSIVQKLGIKHVKGILLFGPPGTGKTLIARQLGKMLNGKEPKVVNGPEVLNKYVGQSEENIRNLFAEADAEYASRGDASDLHVIIFDEIDAVCKARGSVRDGSGVHDTVVNQLLTKIDGVNALNNILLIGMTNRKDMLDEALLRPGRLEVQIEIGLPDEAGRLQILQIHTSKMSENSFLGRDVDLPQLSMRTKNFSGAEIEGLVKDAAAYALNRQVDVNDLHKALSEENIKVTKADFDRAFEEVKPAFGAQMDQLEMHRIHGMLNCGETFSHLQDTLRTLVKQVRQSEKTPLMSCLLEGPAGCGKTALAVTAAIESDFPYVKVIGPEQLVGYQEQNKCSQILKVFEDAYRSPLSVVILDDIERLLEYVAIGPRFSNPILQTIQVAVKRTPPAGHKLLIIGTTSAGDVMESMGLNDTFNVNLHVPTLRMDEIVKVLRTLDVFELKEIPQAVDQLMQLASKSVAVKKLLLWVELAKQDLQPGSKISLNRWQSVLKDLSS